jgi:hypothetical protein
MIRGIAARVAFRNISASAIPRARYDLARSNLSTETHRRFKADTRWGTFTFKRNGPAIARGAR